MCFDIFRFVFRISMVMLIYKF